tara:strand:- start:244 stop:432 length:189 start_codon:yes stop_codon:yes gene_type:complete
MMIEYITLLGIIFIGLGLGLQGWFILDLNKRLTTINASLFIKLENLQTHLQNASGDEENGES